VRAGSGGDTPKLGDQVMVSYTARVMDESGLPGRIYDGSKHFQFTLGEGEVRVLYMRARDPSTLLHKSVHPRI